MTERIDIVSTNNTRVIDVMADVDIDVQENPADFSELIGLVIARTKGHANLPPGSYNVRLLCVITENEGSNVDKAS
ncbi:MAG TPA: hypothetical protein VIL29_00345 [Pseudothermotoga sp.]